MQILKTSIKYLFFALALALSLISCQHKEFMEPTISAGSDYQRIVFGHKDFTDITIETRSTLPESAEARIMNLYAFIFDANGELVYKHFFDSEDRVEDLNKIISDHRWYVHEKIDGSGSGANVTWGEIRVKSPNVTNGKLYLIANIDEALFNVTRSTLSHVQTIQELEDVVCVYNEPSHFRMGNFIMEGKCDVNINGNTVTLANGDYEDKQNSGNPTDRRLMLKRIDSKITVKVGIIPGAMTHRTESLGGVELEVSQEIESFTPLSWQVINLPMGCKLIGDVSDASDEEKRGYFNSVPLAFEGSKEASYHVPADDAGNALAGTTQSRTEHSFSFYMVENRQSANRHASVGANGYHLRDKRVKKADGSYDLASANQWQYAPENGTYLRIEGTVKMKYREDAEEGSAQTLHSLAVYYIHLGDINPHNQFMYYVSDEDDTLIGELPSLDNYDVHRNFTYNYTINIHGVDKMQLEVELDNNDDPWSDTNEKQSGATGEVFVSQEDIYVFDAHYDQRVFRFNVESMLKQCGGDVSNLTWFVDTPFGRKGIPEVVGDGTEIPLDLDYKWVSFMLNSKAASYVEPHGAADGSSLTIQNPQGEGRYSQLHRIWPGEDSPELMDVLELCYLLRTKTREYLNSGKTDHSFFDEDGNIYVTAFIDEFYYDVDPISGNPRASLWREFVNKPMRTMHIMCNSSSSRDGDSNMIKSAVSIRQLSIQTIYNLENSTEGWGSESTEEMGNNAWFFNRNERRELRDATTTIPSGVNNNSLHNGLYNTGHLWGLLTGGSDSREGGASANFVSNKKWAEHLDYIHYNSGSELVANDVPNANSPNYHMRNSDTDATLRYSCLMRNRDENGDGIMQKEEIKWYLASLGQLQHLYVGEMGVSGAARLYNIVEAKNNRNSNPNNNYWLWRSHVICSTRHASERRPIIVWAEEGVSFNTYNREWNKEGLYSVRCVRNLNENELDPKDMANPNDYPEQVIAMTVQNGVGENGENYYSFDLSRLNSLSTRMRTSTELLPLDEKSQMALPYKRFETGPLGYRNELGEPQSMTAAHYKNELQNQLKKGISICPTGYRLPNVREMCIAYLYIPHSDTNFWRTATNSYNIVANYYSFGNPATGGTGYDSGDSNKITTWGFSPTNITVAPENTNWARCVRDLE